jgi:hypothetical protein
LPWKPARPTALEVTSEVGKAMKTFDKPPVPHRDYAEWTWNMYDHLPAPQWSPLAGGVNIKVITTLKLCTVAVIIKALVVTLKAIMLIKVT